MIYIRNNRGIGRNYQINPRTDKCYHWSYTQVVSGNWKYDYSEQRNRTSFSLTTIRHIRRKRWRFGTNNSPECDQIIYPGMISFDRIGSVDLMLTSLVLSSSILSIATLWHVVDFIAEIKAIPSKRTTFRDNIKYLFSFLTIIIPQLKW